MFRHNLNQVAREIARRNQRGLEMNPRQVARVNEVRAMQGQRPLNGQEIDLLNMVNDFDYGNAVRNQQLRDAQELLGYKRQTLGGQEVSNPSRFEELLGKEKANRKQKQTKEFKRNATIGGGAMLGAAALGAGATGAAVLANGGELFPFSFDMSAGDIGELSKKQALIERELEKREFEDLLAQETIAAQTQLANDLYARQQRGALDTQMAVIQQQALAGQGAMAGPAVDVIGKVERLAAEFQAQGIDPDQAYSKAVKIIELDGRANNYF